MPGNNEHQQDDFSNYFCPYAKQMRAAKYGRYTLYLRCQIVFQESRKTNDGMKSVAANGSRIPLKETHLL